MENKDLIILAVVVLVVALGFALIMKDNKFGGGLNVLPNSYSGGVTNSSTTVNKTATSILAKNADRLWATICNDDSGVVWIYETATSTGMVINQGYPIASSTVYNHCYTIDDSHPYTGQVYGIASATSIVKYIER